MFGTRQEQQQLQDQQYSNSGGGNALDSLDAVNRFNQLRGFWYEARAAHAENREQQAIDEDFKDSIQWESADIRELEERGQKALVYNEIKPAVEWLIGTERRTRVDWKILPRTQDDRQSAETKTKLLKYVSDVNKFEFNMSRAFGDTATVGCGWAELGIRSDVGEEPLFVRYESWRNIWLDPLSMELDISDARYLMRSKIVDYDIAKQMFPGRADVVQAAIENAFHEHGILYDQDLHDVRQNIDTGLANLAGLSNDNVRPSYRKVIRLTECWYRVPVKTQVMRGHPNFDGLSFDPNNQSMVDALLDESASIYESIKMQVRVAVFCNRGLLQDMDSPYRHNRFPFVPLWAYRRGRDNMPYGIVRASRDPQMDLNKRRSKALFLLSVNRTIMDEGAVKDLDEYIEEVSRPDAVIVKKQGKELHIETNVQLAEEHIALGNQSAEYIRNISGVTGENLGQETNATSGKAILARQNQGTVTTASLFDNKRLFVQLTGEMMLSLIEQFYDFYKVVRIVGDSGADDFLSINEMMPDGTISNPITNSQADFKVAEQDSSETERMAQFGQLIEIVRGLDSSVALNFMDLVFEYSDVPGAEEFVRRFRQLNGYSDPNDPNAQQLEEQQQQAKQQKQQEQEEMQKQQVMADIRAKTAQAENNEAKSQQTKIDSMTKAFEAALAVLQAQPVVAQTANDLLQGADEAQPGKRQGG
jgi:hypothetical protein